MSMKRLLNFYMALFFCFACFTHTSHADQVANPDANLYKIGIGDILTITTWKEPDFTVDSVRVRSDGKITFPLLDDIQAEGLSTMVLKMAVQKKLSVFVEAPNVTVTLINPMSRQFYILGEILRTGEYPLIKKLTVMQAFALAGGFTEWADKNKILLYRRGNNKEETIIIRYKDIINGDFSKDIQLQPDDTIIVP
ncbi:MAG: polysaccharide export protein [Proteobacteria bacterium]|nr:polysaccharide export protein [Pseudomonadota bacterium]